MKTDKKLDQDKVTNSSKRKMTHLYARIFFGFSKAHIQTELSLQAAATWLFLDKKSMSKITSLSPCNLCTNSGSEFILLTIFFLFVPVDFQIQNKVGAKFENINSVTLDSTKTPNLEFFLVKTQKCENIRFRFKKKFEKNGKRSK